jgi:F0F1-type ATP synthase membrane subunit c/vacuolar-type H+-ATPase subunit K
MLIVTAAKIFVFMGCMLPIGLGALSTGILFAGYNLSAAKNPEESESLFNTTLMGFALIETFVFLSIILGVVVYLI